VYETRAVNRPGESGSGEPGRIVFRRADGVRVEYRQVMRIRVAPGEPVTAGQPVARLGNNGAAAMPAVRIAAWRGGTPLQVRFDPRATRPAEARPSP
jgi:murein DD-endopeptidase MepM/ murein hydrolase activator NlpD